MAILEVRELTIRFGGHLAVDAIDLSVEGGVITGLIGPNGAGKTTMFNAITGLQQADHGRVELGGVDITKVPAHKRSLLGMSRTFQRLETFGSLSVLDNVLTAAELTPSPDGVKPRQTALDLVARVGLADQARVRADSLSTGNARLVELARALACQPRVLLLDEPASGLDEFETKHFADLLVELANEGMAVLLVEHDVPLVMSLCTTITVLNFGRVLATGTPVEIQNDESVIDAYLGQAVEPGVAT